MKILLSQGVNKAEIVFLRLIGSSLVLGAVLVVRPSLFSRELLFEVAAVGLIGFTLPLFITLNILQRVTLRGFSLLLFLYPILTYAMSAAAGLVKLYSSDVLAAMLIFGAIAVYETWSEREKV